MNLLESFKGYLSGNDATVIASTLGVYPSIVKRWQKGTHTPKLETLSHYHDKVFSSLVIPPKHTAHVEKEVSGSQSTALGKWDGRNVCMLMPWYDGTNTGTAFALFATGADYGIKKIYGFAEPGHALLYKARNKLADQFLATEAEWGLWLDDDIIPPIGRSAWFKWIGQLPDSFPEKFAGRHWVERLMSHKKKLVGGLYFGRQQRGQPMFHEGLISRQANIASRSYTDEVRATEWIPTGCKLVHRSVYEDIRKTYPELAPKTNKDNWGFYNPIESAGEDVSFCIRAKKADHQAYIDLGLIVLHLGYAAYGPHNTTPPS